MKKAARVIGVCLAILFCLAAYPAYRIFEFQHYYGEAEPLVETVWPLAHSFKEFEEIKGRRPISLKELVVFSGDRVNEIEHLKHNIYESGPIIFKIQVNKKYGFQIDEDYRPTWTTEDTEQNKSE